MSDPWDLVVLGGGSAGLVGSKTAAGFGARVLLIENDRLGGECLWTGCVPSKALVAAAHRIHQARTVRPDWSPSPKDRVDAVRSVRAAIDAIAPTDSAEALNAAGVTVCHGTAVFTSLNTLQVGDETIDFRQVLLATGAGPQVPAIDGIESVAALTSESFWELDALPERILILGGGAIGCELGQALARLGTAVTIVHRRSRILPKEDPRVSAIVHDALLRDGVTLLTDRSAVRVSSDDGFSGRVELDDGTAVEFDRLLVALGRVPRTAGIGLDAADVRLGEDGVINVDSSLRSVSNSRVWAAGDVTAYPRFTHTAGVHGSTAATNAILGLRRRVDKQVVPRVTFTAPEVAAVGVQPHEAVSGRHRVVTWEHIHADRAVTEGDTGGFTSIVVDRRGHVVGGTAVGPRAGETIGEVTLAVSQRLRTSDIAATTHPYPTYNDAFWNAAVADVRRRLGRPPVAWVIRVLAVVRRARMTR